MLSSKLCPLIITDIHLELPAATYQMLSFEDFATEQTIKSAIYAWQGVSIPPSHIHLLMVHTEMYGTTPSLPGHLV